MRVFLLVLVTVLVIMAMMMFMVALMILIMAMLVLVLMVMLVAMVLVFVIMLVFMIVVGRGLPCLSGYQVHAAFGAATRLILDNFWMHGADILNLGVQDIGVERLRRGYKGTVSECTL